MCGRYLLRNAPDDAAMSWLEYRDRLAGLYTQPRYNICPSQSCIVIAQTKEGVKGLLMPWGFKPEWSNYPPQINARSETLFSSRMFKDSARSQRCLIFADGFYEPKHSEDKSNPWNMFQRQDQSIFTVAGVWTDSGFTIVTRDANDFVSPIHDRMPCILSEKAANNWLKSNTENTLNDILYDIDNDLPLTNISVGDFVKKPGNEGIKCLQQGAKQKSLF